MLTNEFDPCREAVINPNDVVAPVAGFPEEVIGIFSDAIMAQILKEYAGVKIAELHGVCGNLPIYKIQRNGREYGVFMAAVGGPMISGQIEEFGAMGAKAFVLFGCCGVLDGSIAHRNIIVPTAAVRDEGVSYQYLPPSDEVELLYVAETEAALKALAYPYVTGKTWTTDCFYRETRQRMARRKEQGCVAVEMECAAAAAVTRFRGYQFAQFLFAADNLDSEEWDRRNLSDKGIHSYDIYMQAAFGICDNLREKRV